MRSATQAGIRPTNKDDVNKSAATSTEVGTTSHESGKSEKMPPQAQSVRRTVTPPTIRTPQDLVGACLLQQPCTLPIAPPPTLSPAVNRMHHRQSRTHKRERTLPRSEARNPGGRRARAPPPPGRPPALQAPLPTRALAPQPRPPPRARPPRPSPRRSPPAPPPRHARPPRRSPRRWRRRRSRPLPMQPPAAGGWP